MSRVSLIVLVAAGLLGAAKAPTVDYRLGATAQSGAPPLLDVELRFVGDEDGETHLDLPDRFASGRDAWRHVLDLKVSGASVREDGPAHRVLTHKPRARITVRYRVSSTYDRDPAASDGNPYKGPLIRPDWFNLMGEFVFAEPRGRGRQPATFRWGRLPKGWTVASDLEHGRMGRPLTVDDVGQSLTLGGSALRVEARPISGGVLRFAAVEGGSYPIDAMADDIARIVTAQRTYWNDRDGPYFVGFTPLTSDGRARSVGGTGRGDGFALYATEGMAERLRWTMAHEHIHTWIPGRVGGMGGADQPLRYWFSEGVTDFLTWRTMVRAGLVSPEEVVGRMDEALRGYDANPLKTAPNTRVLAEFWTTPDAQKLPYQRGAMLALKWDEDIRRKTGGRVDLDDVILRMRDHYRQFPKGQGPDVATGLVSAAWTLAGLDLRPDIARYVDRGEAISLPEQMFDGCLDTRTTVTPAFDAGFDVTASATAKIVRGVRRGGPAWTSGLRDGQRIDAIDLKLGDTSREIVLTVRPVNGRGKARTIRYWPYGDRDVEARTLALAFGLQGEALAACGRKLGGL